MKKIIFSLIVILMAAPTVFAQSDEGYLLPPKEIVDIIDAAPSPGVSFSPNREHMLLVERDSMPSISDVSRRMLQLAGMRIDPAANRPFATSYSKGLVYRKRGDVREARVPVPKGAGLASVSWCHDSSAFVFVIVTDEGSELWFAKSDNPTQPTRLTKRLSNVMGGVAWLPDGTGVLCQLVPTDRGAEPVGSNVPVGPNIQESSGKMSPTRTYQDLLKNPHDEALFEYYAKNQLAIITLDGAVKKIGEPAIYGQADLSPDGKHLLVSIINKPFSYLMTMRSFPHDIQVWDTSGELEYEVASVPMAENIPIEGVRTGPRSVDWMSSRDATLTWTEALDGGDPNKEAEHRDRIMTCAAPFDSNPNELLKTEHRAFGLTFFADPTTVLTTEYDRDRRWVKSSLHDLKSPGTTPKTVMDRSIRDRYADPGRIIQVVDDHGHSVSLQHGDTIYRSGSGASPKGNLPFLDAQNIKSLETERIWRCAEGVSESVVGLVKDEKTNQPTSFITVRETPTTPPNYFMYDMKKDSKPIQLTDFKDPTPQIRGIKKQLVKYKRADGVDLSATLYLPADYKQGTRLPLIVWAYPREFSDPKTAGQISGSPWTFTRMSSISHLTLLTQGYAIMDAATMPVIGDPETMNDTFIEQIVSSAKAAIDKADEMGVADPTRVGVGGHSYGAFMTANLMAHCDLFNAGVARSGAYNRTLTPFGFQSERRSFWNAKDVYFNISPFMHANKINEPLLLIHGENDNNSGTFPIQSKRMYQAVKGNGGTVRLVMLPKESHGYRARESVLHTQAEMVAWFDKYVKNAVSETSADK